jgi:hypothetical protein
MDITTSSAKQCAQALADKNTNTANREAIIKRVKAMAKTGKTRWVNLLKDINAGDNAKIQARAGIISWAQAKPEASKPKSKPAKQPKAAPDAIDLGELAALLAKPIPSKADRARILALASMAK